VGRHRSDEASWDEWYRRAGRRALATRAPRDERGYFECGARQVQEILDLIGHPTGARLLEIGCGDGRMTLELARRFSSVVALDVSPLILDACRRNLAAVDNVELVLGGPDALRSFPAGSFDCVLSATVFQHIKDRAVIDGYVRETVRLLGGGGGAALQFRNPSLRTKLRDVAVDVARVPSRIPGAGRRWRGCTVRYDDVSALVAGHVARCAWHTATHHAWLLLVATEQPETEQPETEQPGPPPT
jgi:SAM-dependent methyltransferase